MPSSSTEQHELMTKWFGDIDIKGPLKFLLTHGYIEKAGMIRHSVCYHTPTKEEWECITFLCYEWDFGYVRREDHVSLL